MKKIDILSLKAKVIVAGFGIAAEDELNLLRRLEALLFDGIGIGYSLMAERCEAAEIIIATLTMDHNSTPNYVRGFEMAREHFANFPNSPKPNPVMDDLTHGSPIFPIVRIVVKGNKIDIAEMCAPGLPDGEHLLYPVLVDANAVPIKQAKRA